MLKCCQKWLRCALSDNLQGRGGPFWTPKTTNSRRPGGPWDLPKRPKVRREGAGSSPLAIETHHSNTTSGILAHCSQHSPAPRADISLRQASREQKRKSERRDLATRRYVRKRCKIHHHCSKKSAGFTCVILLV